MSFTKQIQPLLNSYCVGCHLTGGAQGNQILESGMAYEALVGVLSQQADFLRVVPKHPQRSYLLHKLRGTHLEVGGEGGRMPPPDGQPLSACEIDLFRRWIVEGAPDN